MKEIELFESWLNSLTEATVLPTSTDKQQELIQLLSEPLPVGADATNAIETLGNLFIDPEMIDDMKDLSETDPNADARPVVMSRMSAYKSQPGIATLMAKIKNTTAQGEQPAAPGPGDEAVDTAAAPAPTAPPPPAEEPASQQPPEQPVPDETAPAQPVAEDSDYDAELADILKKAGVDDCKCKDSPDYIVGSIEEGHSGPFDEGVIGSTVGGAIGSALGPAGTMAGAAVGDWAGEKLAGTEWGKKASKWAADEVGSAASALGGKGAGELARGATSYMLAPDSDTSVSARAATGATGAALSAAGHIPGLAGKIARGASTAYNLYNKGSRILGGADGLEKAAAAGATAFDLLKQPGAAAMAQQLLSKGSAAISDPKVRDTLMQVAGRGAQALAGKKAELGGAKGAISRGLNAVKGASGAVSGKPSSAASTPATTPNVSGSASTVAPQSAPATAGGSGSSWTSGTSIAPTAHFGHGSDAVLRKSQRTPTLHESTELNRLKNLAGIRHQDK